MKNTSTLSKLLSLTFTFLVIGVAPAAHASAFPTIFDYGAVCDGVTDDSAAVQKALNANRIVYVPAGPGYCIINNTVTIPTGVSLVSDTSGIDVNASANCFKTTKPISLFKLAGGYVTLRGLCFRHEGTSTGRIISDNGEKKGGNVFENCGFTGTSNTNSDDLVYFESSANSVRSSAFTNLRTKAFAIRFNAMGGKPQIGNRIESTFFAGERVAGAGNGIFAGSSDGSTRQEGLFVKNNLFVLQGSSNLWIESVLSAHIDGNEFDQAWGNNVILSPTSTYSITSVAFVNNWFSTPNQMADGTCVNQLTNAFPIANISFVGNHFGFCGYGATFYSKASEITFQGNTFAKMGKQALGFSGTKNVILSGNQFSAMDNLNFSLSDGVAGGPFIVTGNQIDPSKGIALTMTNPAAFRFDGTNTGKKLAGPSSVEVSVSSCASQYFNVLHGLAGTPQRNRITASIVAPASGGAAVASPTAYVVAVDATNITVNFQCGLFVGPGKIVINVDASL